MIFFIFQSKVFSFFQFLAGAISSSFLSVFLFFKDGQSFVFNNLGYHQLWGGKVIGMGLLTKFFTLAKFLFYPQNLLILILAALTISFLIKKKKAQKTLSEKDRVYLIAFVFSLIILVGYFLASPTQLQYYHQALPYLLVLSGPGLTSVVEFFRKRKSILYGLAVFYLLCLIPYLLIFVFTIREKDRVFRVDQVRKVIKVVQENSVEEEPILSDWPGYAVLANRSVVRGTETCGQDVSHLLTEDMLKRFKIIDRRRVKDVIRNKEVNLVVTGIGTYRYLDDLTKENYYLLKEIGGAKVFLKK